MCSSSSKIRQKPRNVTLTWNLLFNAIKRKVIEKIFFMTSAQPIIDQELAQFGWVESIANNSISDFKSPRESLEELATDEKTSNLVDTFICHSIFYVIFCYALFLYVFSDLGFGFFLQNKINKLLKVQNNTHTVLISSLSH